MYVQIRPTEFIYCIDGISEYEQKPVYFRVVSTNMNLRAR